MSTSVEYDILEYIVYIYMIIYVYFFIYIVFFLYIFVLINNIQFYSPRSFQEQWDMKKYMVQFIPNSDVPKSKSAAP